MISKLQWDDLCDIVLNGIQVIKGLVIQMCDSPPEYMEGIAHKIYHRCQQMETSIKSLRDKKGV